MSRGVTPGAAPGLLVLKETNDTNSCQFRSNHINAPLCRLLLPSLALSEAANEVLAREIGKLGSCSNMIDRVAFVLRNEAGEVKDCGLISCKSTWCEDCQLRKEIVVREKLKAVLKGFLAQSPKNDAAMFAGGLPDIEETHLYDVRNLTKYWRDARFKRYVLKLFKKILKACKKFSFIRGMFKSEEVKINQRYRDGNLIGHNLNLHFHIVLLLSEVPEILQDEYELSCMLFLAFHSAYIRACKKFQVEPKPLKKPTRDEGGAIKGAVTVFYKSSFVDSEGRSHFESYAIKKSSRWSIEEEATLESQKDEKKGGLTMRGIIDSEHKQSFKENAAKMLVLIVYDSRDYEFSHLKTGPVVQPRPTKRPRPSPSKLVDKLVLIPAPKKRKKKESKAKKATPSKAASFTKVGLAKVYSAVKHPKPDTWKPIIMVSFQEFMKTDRDVKRENKSPEQMQRRYEEYQAFLAKAISKGKRNRRVKIDLRKEVTLLKDDEE